MNTSRILKDFGKLLKKNHQEMRRQLSDTDTDCFRVYNHNIGIIPWYVDFYGKYLHIASSGESFSGGTGEKDGSPVKDESDIEGGNNGGESDNNDFDGGNNDFEGDYNGDNAGNYGGERELEEWRNFEADLLEEASSKLYVPFDRIRFKKKAKQGREFQHERQSDEHLSFWVREYGLSYFVNLSDYIDTGLFLDHRLTRQYVREAAAGLRVCNLFAYTGGFSVSAAAGGAEQTVTVDLSKNYLRWAQKNMEANGFIGDSHRYIEQDAKEFLDNAAAAGEKYHLVILDPPTFSNSRKMKGTFDIQRDYIRIIGSALSVTTKEGAVLFSTNKSRFHFDPGRLKGAYTEEISKDTVPIDFSGKRRPHRSWVIRK